MSLYLGIDPGKSGAAALITHASQVVSIQKFDATEKDISDWFDQHGDCEMAVVEIVTRPCKLVQSYGFLRGMLVARDIRREFIASTKWQVPFGLRKKKSETQTQKKNRHKARAQEIFPGVTIDHANADALLLAEYCRRLNT